MFIFSLLISFDYHSENFASPKVFFEVRHDGKCVGKEQIRHLTFVDSLCPLILFFLNFFYFLFIFWLCWVFIAARGLSLVVLCRLLIAVASLVVDHGL